MSIFKETIPSYLQQQLKIREEILGLGLDGGGRTSPKTINTGIEGPKGAYGDITIDSHAFYTNHANRQCVIRMSSGVDLAEDDVLETNNRFETWESMKGPNMAQRYILQGGTLVGVPRGQDLIQANRKGFPGTFNKGNQRTMGMAYGDPMIRSDANADGYGIVPMPGIISANIRTKSAYGSLREAKVNFVCHNQRQLEILEMLYMRPGYTLLLEWGWSPYVDNYGKIQQKLPQINGFFDTNATHNYIEREIIRTRIITGGNYDAILGFVKNFQYKLRPDGGFDCETELIARGEVLESLKMNKEGIYNEKLAKEEGNSGWENKDILEIILDKILEYSISNDKSDDFWPWLFGKRAGHQAKAEAMGKNLAELAGPTFDTDQDLYPHIISKDSGLRKADGTPSEGNKFTSTYVRWDFLSNLINRHVIPQSPKGYEDGRLDDPLFQIVTTMPVRIDRPSKNISTLLYNQIISPLKDRVIMLNNMPIDYTCIDMSLDPSVCLLPHQVYDLGDGTLNIGGMTEFAKKPLKWIYNIFASDENDYESKNTGDLTNYNLPPDVENRQIAKIYFNVDHLKSVHKSLAYDGEGKANADFTFHDWLKKIWDDVNDATANTHDFTINVDSLFNNNVRIIDLSFNKNDPELDLNTIYTFNIQSPNSTVREVAYNSSIPSAMSATIAIAAQAPDSVDDLEKVTFSALNKGIRNRFTEKNNKSENKIPDEEQITQWRDELDAELNIIYTTAHINKGSESQSGTLVKWRTDMLQGKGNEKDDEGVATDKELIDEMKGALNALQNSSDRIYKKYGVTKKEEGIYYGMPKKTPTQPRAAIIPLKFNCKLDGIGGMIIGNVFKLPKDKLPKGYNSNSVCFITLGEEQNISGQDWTTTLNGHLTLLGEEETAEKFDEGWDPNSFDEWKGVYTPDGQGEITVDQKDIDEAMNRVSFGDYVYLKITSSPTSCRTSPEINNERLGTIDSFDNTVGMFDEGNGGKMLGRITDIRLQDPTTEATGLNRITTLFYGDQRSIKKETKIENKDAKDGDLATSTDPKKDKQVYYVRKDGEWKAIDPDSINLFHVWYEIELIASAFNFFNNGWVMQLGDSKTVNGETQNTWKIDKNGADKWEHLFIKGDAPTTLEGPKMQLEISKALKEDGLWRDTGAKARSYIAWAKNSNGQATGFTLQKVWMRIDTLQASSDFTVDEKFEAAVPKFETISD
jgi:hypothetical protein